MTKKFIDIDSLSRYDSKIKEYIDSSGSGGGGGTSNYNALTNKPKINNVELNGNKSLSELGIQPAGNYLTEETDPTVPSYVKNITQANITSWNNKSDFSGNYNDLTNKPTIPSEPIDSFVLDRTKLPYESGILLTQQQIIEIFGSMDNFETYKDYVEQHMPIYIYQDWTEDNSDNNNILVYKYTVQKAMFMNESEEEEEQTVYEIRYFEGFLEQAVQFRTNGTDVYFSFWTTNFDEPKKLPIEIDTLTPQSTSEEILEILSMQYLAQTAQDDKHWVFGEGFGERDDLLNILGVVPQYAYDEQTDTSLYYVTIQYTKTGNKLVTFVFTWDESQWTASCISKTIIDLSEYYIKPVNGIPKTDLASGVQTSLDKADTALQTHQDISGKLDTSKVKNANSTTAGDVYDVTYINSTVGDIESLLAEV